MRLVARIAAVAVLATALLAAVPAVAASAAEGEREESTLVLLLNQARIDNGQEPLKRLDSLDAVARAWAERLALTGRLSQNPKLSSEVPDGWLAIGENIAQGPENAATMHFSWMNSASQRANIFGDFTAVGVAFLSAGGTTWGVEVFARYPSGAQLADSSVPSRPGDSLVLTGVVLPVALGAGSAVLLAIVLVFVRRRAVRVARESTRNIGNGMVTNPLE